MTATSSSRSPVSEEVKALFHYPCHSFITRSAVEGHMGCVTVCGSTTDGTLAARADLGVFSVLAGSPNEELVAGAMPSVIVMIVNPAWAPLITRLLPSHTAYTRYPMKAPLDGFDVQRLQQLADACPTPYTVVPIDESIAECLTRAEWSCDLNGNFDNARDFVQRGLGFVAIDTTTGTVAAGASTFAVCDAGIELEVDTDVPHQRRGLARACSARLLLACLERGWKVSWDAHVQHSAVLAEQLGYVYGTPYVAYTTDLPPSSKHGREA
jgi:GNAT superfamily N-acetyltransferase